MDGDVVAIFGCCCSWCHGSCIILTVGIDNNSSCVIDHSNGDWFWVESVVLAWIRNRTSTINDHSKNLNSRKSNRCSVFVYSVSIDKEIIS